ncbi:MAG: murein biosynthesis integral membrane protein MurJ [bacterium]
MIRKLFCSKINSISVAAGLVAISSLASRILGIFRDRILAGQFGAGDTLDIYYAAFRIPDLIFNLIVLGALSAGFIPIFTNLIKDHKQTSKNKEAWELTSNIFNILLVTIIVLSVIGIIIAPYLMKWITPGFDGEKLAATITLARIMFLSPILLGASSVLGGVLQSFKRFFLYSLSPIFYNLGIIIGVLWFVPLLGMHGLAWGVILGSLLHMLIQLPAIISLGFKYHFSFKFTKAVREVARMMTARTLSLAINQINLVVITIVASTLVSGSLAVFNLANNLQSFPIGIFGISFAIAVFPVLSANAFDRPRLIEYFSKTIRQILFFIIPSTVLMIVLRAQIVRVILGSGKFDWQDTIMTIDALTFFAISFFAQATIPLLTRMFYARHNSKTPFYVGLVSVVLNVLLSLYFSRTMGVAGLAFAFSISSALNFLLLILLLRYELGKLDEFRIVISVLKFSIAAVSAGVVVQALKIVVEPFVTLTKFWGVLAQGVIAGIGGLIIYFLVCSLLRSQEWRELWDGFKCRFMWKGVKTGDHGEARGI